MSFGIGRRALATRMLPLVACAAFALMTGDGSEGATNFVRLPESAAQGIHPSLVLDESEYAVVSYYDPLNGDLKLLRCQDDICDPNRIVTTPASAGDVGDASWVEVDRLGNPVVSYYDATNQRLAILHCDDLWCNPGGDSIEYPAGIGTGSHSALVLDEDGLPIVAFHDGANGDFKVMHCNDPNCAGGDESITTPDSAGNVGTQISILLNKAGNPVMSYVDNTLGVAKLMRCNDPACAGGDDVGYSLGAASTAASARTAVSIRFSAERPRVVFSGPAFELKIAYCPAADCSTGGSTSTNTIKADYVATERGNTFDNEIAYRDRDTMRLHKLSCTEEKCQQFTVLAFALTPTDAAAPVGISMALEERPVIAFGQTSGPLAFMRCVADCMTTSWIDGADDVGTHNSIMSRSLSPITVAYYDEANGDLKLAQCGDSRCGLSGNVIRTMDSAGDVGQYTSGELDASLRPVVAYYDVTNGNLKILRCNDGACAPGGDTIEVVAAAGDVGTFASLALDGAGLPRVSFVDATNGKLTLVLCNDVSCAGGDEAFVDLWTGAVTYSSLVLSGGRPYVSFYDAEAGALRLARCADAGCGSLVVDLIDDAGDVGEYNGLVFEDAGAAVIGYYDADNGDLKVARCTTPALDCSAGVTITSPDTAGDVGRFTSVVINSNSTPDVPVLTYYDATEGDLRVLKCVDSACSAGLSLYVADVDGDVGMFASMVASSGRPDVAYYDATHGDLKIYRCVVTGGDCNPDADQDGVSETSGGYFKDTCPDDPSPGVASNDENYVDIAPPSVSDYTVVDSDFVHNVCDPDDDNDGLPDAVELAGPPCASATRPTSTTLEDTDGDLYLDGAECSLGKNPNSAASKPALADCGPAGDADGDKLSDRREFCVYGSDPNDTDTDDDPLDGSRSSSPPNVLTRDGCEVASLNADSVVNSGDQGLLASYIIGTYEYAWDVDLTRDGIINSGDQGMMASLISPPGQCP